LDRLLLHLENSGIGQADLTQLFGLLAGEIRQTQAGHEENGREYTGNATQKGSGTLATEHRTRGSRPERRASFRTLALLNQHQTHQAQRHQQMYYDHDSLKHLQLPAARQIAPNSSAFREAPPMRPPSISGMANNSAALAAFTLPPYKILTPRATSALSVRNCERIEACTS